MKKFLAVLSVTLAFLALAVAPAAWADSASEYSYSDQDSMYLLTPEELDDLLAPIALYPDPLIAQILPAATFLDQVQEASDFVKRYGQSPSIDQQPWDVSVKAVAHYPYVLAMMADKPDWTASLGQAFIDQQQDVMDAVQRLRAEAREKGNLYSTPEQQVIYEEDAVRIVPARPEYVYVPVYDPQVVYVERYNPVYPFITFSTGFAIGAWLNRDCDWRHRRVYYHGWHGTGWVHRARPHIHDRRGIYINRQASVIHLNNRVLLHDNSRFRQELRDEAWRRRGLQPPPRVVIRQRPTRIEQVEPARIERTRPGRVERSPGRMERQGPSRDRSGPGRGERRPRSEVQPAPGAGQPPAAAVQPPAATGRPPATVVRPPAASGQSPGVAVQPPAVTVQPGTVVVQPPGAAAQPTVGGRPSDRSGRQGGASGGRSGPGVRGRSPAAAGEQAPPAMQRQPASRGRPEGRPRGADVIQRPEADRGPGRVVVPGARPAVPATTRPALPPTVSPAIPTTTRPAVPPASRPAIPPTTSPAIPSVTRPAIPPTTSPALPSGSRPAIPPTTRPAVPPISRPAVPPISRPQVAPEPAVLPGTSPGARIEGQPSRRSGGGIERPTAPSRRQMQDR